MIPVINNIIHDCKASDTLSQVGFLLGSIVAAYGLYTVAKNLNDEQRLESSITTTVTGGAFMVGSMYLANTQGCKLRQYRYQD